MGDPQFYTEEEIDAMFRALPLGGGASDHTQLSNIGTNTHNQIDGHIVSTNNPHAVTKAQVGLGNVPNLAFSGANTGDETTLSIQAKRPLKTIENQSLEGNGNIDLTKNDVGLGNVDNTSDANKPISNATQTALNDKQATLVSGNNIKTINGNSILGTGDITVSGSGTVATLQQVTAGTNKNLINGNNFQGDFAGDGATNTYNSNFLGVGAGAYATNADYSNFLGESAGDSATDADYSNFLGVSAGYLATNAHNSNFLGHSAGQSAASASLCNFLGYKAGENADNANNSNFIGSEAGSSATQADRSNFIGLLAGQGAVYANNSNFLGNESGQYASESHNSNFLGQRAGKGATDARNSNFFGYRAGESYPGNNVGANNIIIGTNISLPNASNSRINIGGVIFGSGTYGTQSGEVNISATANGRVQIGTNVDNTVDRLQVQGTISALPATLPNQVVVKSQLDDIVAGSEYSEFPKYPANFNKIGFAGSSITYEAPGSPNSTFSSKTVNILTTFLGRSITMYNGALFGQSSAGMVSTLPSIISQAPQIILLEISINDAAVPGLTYAQSESNYRNMINQCRNASPSIVPVLYNCFPIDEIQLAKPPAESGAGGTHTEAKRAELCKLSRNLSIELGVQLIDIDAAAMQNKSFLSFDGLHISALAHTFGSKLMAKELIKQSKII